MNTLFPQEQNSFSPTYAPSGEGLSPWDKIKAQLRTKLQPALYQRWIEPLRALTIRPGELKVLCPTLALYQEVSSECTQKIENSKIAAGFASLSIELELAPDSTQEINVPIESKAQEAASESGPKESGEPTEQVFSNTLSRQPNLNPNYLFKHFVHGPSNQFAHASCLNVAENPGKNYNPLFLYGSTGLGKTHLLHAVGNHVMKLFPELIVTYISSERFMNEMIFCIRHNKMWDFRQKYRHCDVFMMDDIQFISGNKAATQEEFFHTFNTLYEAKKQIIITSDLFPQDIPDIEERLRNRFQWGLIADIQPPDVEHRIAILMNKAETLRVKLSHEVAEYIALQAKHNVRELEGALHRIAAFAALQGRKIDKAIAIETFRSMSHENTKSVGIDDVQKLVAERFGIRVADLKSKKRLRALTIPRQIAMFLARQLTQCSFPEIGSKFGGKDHTTVMHAVKKIQLEKDHDPVI